MQRRTYERQQDEIAKMEDFIRRNHYGQKARPGRGPPQEAGADRAGSPAARDRRAADGLSARGRAPATSCSRVEHLAKGYDQPLFADLSFDILRGEKWGILGPNGSGKTTLLHACWIEVQPDEGRVILGTGVKVGYFDQLLADLDDETLVVDAVRPATRSSSSSSDATCWPASV